MKIHVLKRQKPKPKVGDRKLIKGVLHERRLKYAYCPVTGATIGLDCTGGRQRYEWVEVEGNTNE